MYCQPLYKATIPAYIHGEDLKIIIILEIVECLNCYDNEFIYDEKIFFYYPIFVSHDILILQYFTYSILIYPVTN